MSWKYSEVIDLASDGYFYPSDHPFYGGSVKLFPLTARCEDILCSTTLSKKGLLLPTLLKEVLEVDVDFDTILQCDIDTILLNLKIVAYGPDARYKIKCPVCDSLDEYTVSYAFKSRNFSFDGLEKGKNELTYILPSSGKKVKYRLPTFKENKILVNYGWLTFIKNQTSSIEDVVDVEQFYDYEISINDVKSFKKHYELNTPGFDTRFNLTCPSCGNVTNTKLEVDSDIFGFTPAHKRFIHEEIFNFCYRSNGAFPQNIVYDMPVYIRQFYIKNLIDTKNKEKAAEAEAASSGKTPKPMVPNRPQIKTPKK